MTTPLTLRSGKGSPLTHDEVDANFSAVRNRADATRRLLNATLDLYVRTDGDDGNNGLSDTAGGAYLTIAKALSTAALCDRALFGVVIHVGGGNQPENLEFWGNNSALYNLVDVTIIGDQANPENVSINSLIAGQVKMTLRGVNFTSYVYLDSYSVVTLSNCHFTSAYLQCYGGSSAFVDGCSWAGSAYAAILAQGGGRIDIVDQSVIGTPAYDVAFAVAERTGSIMFLSQPTGSATGKRFDVKTNGVIDTRGGGPNYLPGDVAGTTATGGQYA